MIIIIRLLFTVSLDSATSLKETPAQVFPVNFAKVLWPAFLQTASEVTLDTGTKCT